MPQLSHTKSARRASAPERMTSRQKLTLVVLLGAVFMLAVDFSVLTVALPVIGDDLGFTRENLQWIVTGFVLPAAGFTLLFGRVSDLFGRRRLFLVGVALLGAGSLVGGLAASPAMLLVARVAQGLATAMAVPAALSILTISFAEGPARTRALGLNGAVLTGGFTIGALLGGVLTDVLSWRWAFLINLPVAALILAATPALIAESRNREHTRLDAPGAVTVTGGLLALVYGVTRAGSEGLSSPAALISLVLAGALLVAFWLIEARSPNPLAPVQVLRRRTVGWGNLGGFAIFSMASGVVFLMTLYLQDVLDRSPLATGLAFGGAGLAAVAGGIAAPRIMGRLGTHASLVIAVVIQGLGIALLLGVGQGAGGIILVIAALSVAFFGHAYGITAYMVTATSGLPDEQQGLATGLTTLSQQIALTLGTPILSAIAVARTSSLEATRSTAEAMLGGIHHAVAIDVIVHLAAAALIAIFLLRHRSRSQRAAGPVPAAEPSPSAIG